MREFLKGGYKRGKTITPKRFTRNILELGKNESFLTQEIKKEGSELINVRRSGKAM